jgi:uncharacterized protein (DUF849 family)
MNNDVFITCAVTGSGDTTGKSHLVPITPEQIANNAIEAAKAGAAIAHCHVRDPDTGAPARNLHLYKEVVDRIRDADTDVVINLTAGMGGDIILGSAEAPLPLADGSDMVGASVRTEHIRELMPEICTLDCGTMNFSHGDYIMANTPSMLRSMAKQMQDAGVRPEIEVFDTGHLVLAKKLVSEGLIDDPVLVQLCMGIPYGAPDDVNTLMSMVNNMPQGWIYSAFSIGRGQLPYAALAPITGGNVRVGLEDNIYLSRGELATNAQLVDRAATILTAMNINIMTAADVRKKLKLQKR